MRFFTCFLLSALIVSTGCGDQANKHAPSEGENKPSAPISSRLNEEGTRKLVQLLTDYYSLKNAFVASNQVDANLAAEQLMKTSSDFQLFLLQDSTVSTLATTHLDSIKNGAQEISLTVSDIEKMRVPFEKVSNNMYALLQKFELKNARVYHEYCPMAFDDKGAYWLSGEAEIRNPYFGKKMLECGEVTDSLQ